MTKIVVFLGTGGTIAGQSQSAGDNVNYKAAQLGIDALLESVPGLRRALGVHDAECEQVVQINSKDMEFSHWLLLAQRLHHHMARAEVAGVVITHGTDTLEETAYFLHRVLPGPELMRRPVVLTCAMRPSSSSNADGPGNLEDAVSVATASGTAGVLVVCAGKVHAGLHVQKVHPYRVDAFDSGEAGPLGYVEEGRVRIIGQPKALTAAPVVLSSFTGVACPRVEIVTNHSGATGELVRDMVHSLDASPNRLRGIVIAGTGNASIHEALERELQIAAGHGIWIWRTTRCAYGQVVAANTGAEEGFKSVPLSPVKARIEMQLQIMTGLV